MVKATIVARAEMDVAVAAFSGLGVRVTMMDSTQLGGKGVAVPWRAALVASTIALANGVITFLGTGIGVMTTRVGGGGVGVAVTTSGGVGVKVPVVIATAVA